VGPRLLHLHADQAAVGPMSLLNNVKAQGIPPWGFQLRAQQIGNNLVVPEERSCETCYFSHTTLGLTPVRET